MTTTIEGENSNEYVCKICGYLHRSTADARACESKAIKGNELTLGQKFILPFNGGVLFEVIRLLAASHISHDPGVRAKALQGDLSPLYIGEVPLEQIFDEETAKKYLVE